MMLAKGSRGFGDDNNKTTCKPQAKNKQEDLSGWMFLCVVSELMLLNPCAEFY